MVSTWSPHHFHTASCQIRHSFGGAADEYAEAKRHIENYA
jgi:hypothetical protein